MSRELLAVLRQNKNRDLFFFEDAIWRRNEIGAATMLWSPPDLQGIANEIEAIITGYFPDWSDAVFEYGVDYYAGEGIVWSIVALHVEMRDDTVEPNQDLLQALEDHGKYAFLAEALIDTIYRGEEVKP